MFEKPEFNCGCWAPGKSVTLSILGHVAQKGIVNQRDFRLTSCLIGDIVTAENCHHLDLDTWSSSERMLIDKVTCRWNK